MRRLSILCAVVLCLAGTVATASADNTITPPTADFGSVSVRGTSAPQAFTISAVDHQMTTSPEAFGNGQYEVTTNDCPPVLKVGESCSVSVVFKPFEVGLQIGVLASVAAIPSGGPTSPTAALSGTGLAPPPAPAPPHKKKRKKRCKKKKGKGAHHRGGGAAARKKCSKR